MKYLFLTLPVLCAALDRSFSVERNEHQLLLLRRRHPLHALPLLLLVLAHSPIPTVVKAGPRCDVLVLVIRVRRRASCLRGSFAQPLNGPSPTGGGGDVARPIAPSRYYVGAPFPSFLPLSLKRSNQSAFCGATRRCESMLSRPHC